MIDINLIRDNPELVKANIKKKFQDKKLSLVDEIIELDKKKRALQSEGDTRRAQRNSLAKNIGALMRRVRRKKRRKQNAFPKKITTGSLR